MSHRFIESVCFQDGSYKNLPLHQARVNKTFAKFFHVVKPIQLDHILPKVEMDGNYKVRMVYDADSEDVEFIEYRKRNLQSLEIIESKSFDYSFKHENRSIIDQLVKKSKADDIIISFHGEIKDSSYSNLAFWNGEEWLTPEKPLLEGVKRAQLLAEGKIKKAPIHVSDLGAFEKVCLINAMLDLGELEINSKKIFEDCRPSKISTI